jgi:hypothetical protein
VSNLSTISLGEQATFRRDDNVIGFALVQHADVDFYSTSSLKQIISISTFLLLSLGRYLIPLIVDYLSPRSSQCFGTDMVY